MSTDFQNPRASARGAVNPSAAAVRQDYTATLVIRTSTTHPEPDAWGSGYPINAMRNAALEAAPTDVVLLLDVDFVPNTGLPKRLWADRELWKRMVAGEIAVVLPAFEADGGKPIKASASLWRAQQKGTVRQYDVKNMYFM